MWRRDLNIAKIAKNFEHVLISALQVAPLYLSLSLSPCLSFSFSNTYLPSPSLFVSSYCRLGGHPQQMPQSMSTGSNTIGHGGIDRGVGLGSGVGVGMPMGAGTMPGGVGVGPGGVGGGPQVSVGPPGSGVVGGGGGPHCQISGSQPLVMPGFPLRNSHSAHAPHYSPYSPSR